MCVFVYTLGGSDEVGCVCVWQQMPFVLKSAAGS